jgi:DNA polymerase-3 subunit gamma/tau
MSSYTVLARKYRPRSFSSLVGQVQLVQTLTNALKNQRTHHAYLLTGTRGVGKTSTGRLLAKCLNCETGITATPCDQCASCTEIDAGRSIDLIEIDAASNTKVEDTRDLLNNVQYAPTRDRFKIYLIDEVHMLSGHSFNALLKTLEEPPAHVKFILATTDPQKLPATILSRCLQFHLKNISPEVISKQLEFVCAQEKISAETAALQQIAHLANGSMRDALSLLDQAIAYSNGNLKAQDVQAMLGTIAKEELFVIIEMLAQQNGLGLMRCLENLVTQGADCEQILESLLSLLHRISVAQVVPEVLDKSEASYARLIALSQLFNKEQVQLLYQIALIGRRDITWAPTRRSGLEMILLRMLSFVPDSEKNESVKSNNNPIIKQAPIKDVAPAPITKPVPQPTPPQATPSASISWTELIQQLNLSGLTLVMAQHCALQNMDEGNINLQIDPIHAPMANDRQKQRLQELLSAHFNKPLRVSISVAPTTNSPAEEQRQTDLAHRSAAKEKLEQDPHVQNILQQFSAKIDENSIKPRG